MFFFKLSFARYFPETLLEELFNFLIELIVSRYLLSLIKKTRKNLYQSICRELVRSKLGTSEILMFRFHYVFKNTVHSGMVHNYI